MKVAVSAESNDIEQNVNPMFGRCPGFLIIEIENKEIKNHSFISNKAVYAGGGAGIAAAQEIASQGVEAIISGNIGPNAFIVLQQSGIKIFQATGMSVKDAVKKMLEGKLKELTVSSVPGHFGMGKGRGFGRGAGRRRGRARAGR
ncbi:MAG: NifB/NifX family molybdenum-iron cluster-binding protein [Candidatus Diapherotrites archaeon]|nr:NifB/NifX family molybdenum-iron cluster-binding protein [Candidatus Diapherotrites archaeon]